MVTSIWIIIAIITAAIGYFVAMTMSKKNASSRANAIMDDANREAQVLKEKKLLEAREEAMKVMADAERNASQKMQKAQAGEARVKTA